MRRKQTYDFIQLEEKAIFGQKGTEKQQGGQKRKRNRRKDNYF